MITPFTDEKVEALRGKYCSLDQTAPEYWNCWSGTGVLVAPSPAVLPGACTGTEKASLASVLRADG